MKEFTGKNGQTYCIEEVTAIAASADEYNEEYRQHALYVYSVNESGEKSEEVVFGWNMPETQEDFDDMGEDMDAWDGCYETIESIRR